MSLKYEQYRALKMSRDFMRGKCPKTVKEWNEKTSRCLRHFPFLEESGKPVFSNDNYNDNQIEDDIA